MREESSERTKEKGKNKKSESMCREKWNRGNYKYECGNMSDWRKESEDK